MNKLVEGGQGRTSEEVEALGEGMCRLIVVSGLVFVLWFLFCL